MKYQKTFYTVCGVVFFFTITVIVWLILNVLKIISVNSGVLMFMFITLVSLLFLSFCCICILKTIYDDHKARSVSRNAKWHK